MRQHLQKLYLLPNKEVIFRGRVLQFCTVVQIDYLFILFLHPQRICLVVFALSRNYDPVYSVYYLLHYLVLLS
jgi:hypothetical protein